MRDYDIKSDLKQEQFQTLKLVQGDRGNKIKINVFEEGQPVNLAGCSVTAKYKRSDGEVINNGIIEQEFSSDENFNINYFYAVMNSDITKVSGTLKMIFSIEKDDVKVSTFLLLADVREGIGENTGSSGGNTGDSTGEVTVDLSNYYKKSETYSKEQIDSQFKDIANKINSGNIGNSVEPALMDMPRIFFSEGTLPTTKTATTLKFDYYSKTTEYHGWAEIKCQGNSSMSYPKKNFTIKLYKDKEKTQKLKIDFKGWGKQFKFVLKANWIDITHARNDVSARIWADIVKSRSGYANLPELLRTSPNQGAVDGFPVIVYGNGYYQGRYTLNIPKDKWMSNMDDSLDTHCILCGENYVSGCFRATANINGSDWTDELHDTVPASIKTRWNECISFVMNSSDEEFKTNLHNYFDVDSLIDYLLYGIESCGFDAFGKNQIYFTYDGQKWIASMYDMDSTWGLWWNGSQFVATDYPRESFEDYNGSGRQGNLLYIRLQQLFVNEIKARYAELKQTIFTYPYLVNKFEEFVQICPLDIVKEDYANTTANGAYTGIPSRTTNNIQQIRSYINARLTYVDSYINSLTPPAPSVPCTGITLNTNNLVFEHSTTAQTLTATLTPTNTTDSVVWSVSPTGICTVNNGVVTPVSNGSCVITATCGTQSASCNVTVNLPNVSVTALSLDKDSATLCVSETDTSNINLLDGIDATLQTNGDLIFNEIVLNKGFYVLKNINGGTNTWLKITINNNASTCSNNTTEKGFYILEDNSSVKAQCCLVEGNTKDNLGLYKINNIELGNSTALVKTGDGYFIPSSTQAVSDNRNEYSIVDLDSSKKYCVRTNSSSLYSVALSCITCAKDTETIKTIQEYPSYYFTGILIENSNKLYISVSNEVGIENINLVEVTTSNSTVTTYGTDTLTATLTPTNATNQNVTWTVDNENVELVTDGLNCTVKGKAVGNSVVTCTSQDTTNGTISDTCTVTVSETSISSSNLVFKIDGTCLNQQNNTLIDKIAGIQASLSGTPSLANNNLIFNDGSTFIFDLNSLNLTSINNITFRVKFKPTSLDTSLGNIFGFGDGMWSGSVTGYINNGVLRIQHGNKNFTNATIGISDKSTIDNTISSASSIDTEYEVVYSYKKDTSDIRIFVNGILIQNGNSTSHNYVKLFNNESTNRFNGEYILIEVYTNFVDTYEEFTNMA